MPTRIHKVVYSPALKVNHFQNLVFADSRSTDINVQAARANAAWPPYGDELCIQTTGLGNAQRPVPLSGGQTSFTQYLVLRGHLKCSCCTSPCVHAHDHHQSGRPLLGSSVAQTMNPPASGAHYPGEGYIESTCDLHALEPVRGVATQELAAGNAAALGAELYSEAQKFALTADEIESQLDQAAGIIMAAGEVAKVLAGSATDPMSYVWTAAFLKLWRRLLERGHGDLTLQWPTRIRHQEVRFA